MIDEPRHGGIIAIRFLRLQCNAFSKGTGANAGGIECVDNPQHRLYLIERDIEAIGGFQKIGLQIPGLIHLPNKLSGDDERSEEHTYELQSLMRISYAVFCL